ncbi:MAG: hypothetical protein ACHRXM_33435 [Isosphaerales bacterium]
MNDVTRVMREFLPAHDFEAIRQPVEDWVARGQPRDAIKDYHISLIAWAAQDLERVKLGRDEHRRRHVEEEALREMLEADALGQRLFSSPGGDPCVVGPGPSSRRGTRNSSSPVVVEETTGPAWLVERLESTAAGCRWLLERWAKIRACFEPGRRWISKHSFWMLRLMGRHPHDVLESSEVVDIFLANHALDRRGRNPFMALRGEVSLDEVNDLVRRLGPRVKSTPDRSDAEQGRRTLIAIVERAIAGLTAKAEEHEQKVDADEARRAAGRAFDTSPQGRRLERLERDCKRSVKRTIVTFQRLGPLGVGANRDAAAGVQGPGPANRHSRAIPSKRDL